MGQRTQEEITVTVLVTTFNHELYIEECLNSILSQKTNFRFEILVGVDICKDSTLEICNRIANSFPDIVSIIPNEKENVLIINGKRTGRFNFLNILKRAKGKYIARCDGDDFWIDNNKLQKQYEILEAKQNIICVHGWQKMYISAGKNKFEFADSPKEGHGYSEQETVGVDQIFRNRVRPKSRTIFFRNIFQDFVFPEWYFKIQFGDEALNFILGKYGDFYFINEEMAVYRLTKQGASSVFLNENGQISGVKVWLKLWSSASQFHNNKFLKEASEGMSFFVKRTIKKKNISRLNKLSFLFWILFTSSIQQKLKLKIIGRLFNKNK